MLQDSKAIYLPRYLPTSATLLTGTVPMHEYQYRPKEEGSGGFGTYPARPDAWIESDSSCVYFCPRYYLSNAFYPSQFARPHSCTVLYSTVCPPSGPAEILEHLSPFLWLFIYSYCTAPADSTHATDSLRVLR